MMIRVNELRRFRPGVWLAAVASLLVAGWVGLAIPSLGLRSPISAVVVGAVLCTTAFYMLLVVLCVFGSKTALAVYTGLLIFVADASLRASTSGGFDGQSLTKLAVWGGALIIGVAHLGRASDRFRSARGLLLLFYATLATVSAAWSTTPLYTFGAGLALLSCVLYAAAVVTLLDKVQIVRCIFWGLVIFLLVSNAIVLAAMIGLGVGLDLRYAGLAGSPNNLGRLGALGAILGLLLFKYTKPAALKSSFGGLIGFLALMAANSRTSLIVFVMGAWANTVRLEE
jgi:hypothetical protein